MEPYHFSFFIITGWGIDLDYYDIEIKRCLLIGRKVMTNLDRIFKSRDTLPTKVRLVKAIVFQWSGMEMKVGL